MRASTHGAPPTASAAGDPARCVRVPPTYEFVPSAIGRGSRGNLNPGGQLGSISSFGQDNAGEVYVVSLDGSVYRIEPE